MQYEFNASIMIRLACYSIYIYARIMFKSRQETFMIDLPAPFAMLLRPAQKYNKFLLHLESQLQQKVENCTTCDQYVADLWSSLFAICQE